VIIKSATISQTPLGAYYISILVEYERDIHPTVPITETVLGLDYSSTSLYIDKQSRQIANAYSAVVIEDLNMKQMARGLRLAKSTNDNGFGQFRSMLKYKLAEQGKSLVIIDRWYPSSKYCSYCKHIHAGLTLADRTWTCPNCHTELDRDINAAVNIKNEGCRLLGIV